MTNAKTEYKVELDPVYRAKLEVLLESDKKNRPDTSRTGSQMLNEALAIGINQMLFGALQNERMPRPMPPFPYREPMHDGVGVVDTIVG